VGRNSPLERLAAWKGRYGERDAGALERLLGWAAKARLGNAESLIRLHETALFLRVYPQNARVARLSDAVLFRFAERGTVLSRDEFAAPEVSGIAGTSLTAVFSYAVARRLAAVDPADVEIAWDAIDAPDRMGAVLAKLLPMMREEWPVEAHVPFREWIGARDALRWLLERTEADEYDAMELPLTWNMGDAAISRSRMRLPRPELFYHRKPLLRRSDVSLAHELEGPAIEVRRVARAEARGILDRILETSAMRYRELYGFSHPDEAGVFHADVGRGVDVYFFGVPPRWRLPLRAYHAGMFFKNGVPAGYIELLSLFERAETGFNLYYTFREGETAWIYARLLRLFHQVLGVTCFSVDPYQIGLENPEALDSGAFWFYRKLGFRPVDPTAERLTLREERRMREMPGYRSSRRTLEKLAAGCVIFEAPTAERRVWDRFGIRRLALAAKGARGLADLIRRVSRWDEDAARIVRAKERGSEARYLRLMQQHARLRAAFLRAGSEAERKDG
jgi:hypothetical protein